jgi:phosphorylcholine metabolism protein LicD
MPLDSSALIDFLKEVDKELSRSITLVAVGGTAMTLLRAKPSTVDIDITLPGVDYEEFQKALRNTPHGFTVDCWKDGIVFSQMLPNDYLKRSRNIRKMRHIRLKALHPVDIVVTKIGRLDNRDKQDIRACINKFKLTKTRVTKRAEKITYVGRDENYQINLRHVLENCFH